MKPLLDANEKKRHKDKQKTYQLGQKKKLDNHKLQKQIKFLQKILL